MHVRQVTSPHKASHESGGGDELNLAGLSGGTPSGLIAEWHGTIANIPAGWVICDGNGGTPNLLTKFIQGVATAATDPGAVGGAATHTLLTAEMPAHSHKMVGSTTGSGVMGSADAVPPVSYNTSTVGGGGAHENEPAFYDVAFIMKT